MELASFIQDWITIRPFATKYNFHLLYDGDWYLQDIIVNYSSRQIRHATLEKKFIALSFGIFLSNLTQENAFLRPDPNLRKRQRIATIRSESHKVSQLVQRGVSWNSRSHHERIHWNDKPTQ